MAEPSLMHEYAGALSGGISTLFTAAAFMLKQWWEDRKIERAQESEERSRDKLIEMVRKDLDDRKDAEARTLTVLERNAASLEAMLGEIRHITLKTDKPKNGLAEASGT